MGAKQSSIPPRSGADQPTPLAMKSVNAPPRRRKTAAAALSPFVHNLLGGEVPVRFELWDGSGFGPTDSAGIIHVRSSNALRHILWAPGELGFCRAYVAGDIELSGDLVAMIASLHAAAPRGFRVGLHALPAAFGAASRAGAIGLRLPAPPEEARARGLRHSRRRDARAVRTTTTSATTSMSSCSGRA